MKKSKALKLIIDTNLLVSFIISKKQNLLDPLLYSEEARLLFSKELIAEINQTITKPKLKKYFGTNAFEEMLLAFDPFVDFIDVKSIVTVCRDTKDNFLLALAKDGDADYLLTGDKDLLDLKRFGKTKNQDNFRIYQLYKKLPLTLRFMQVGHDQQTSANLPAGRQVANPMPWFVSSQTTNEIPVTKYIFNDY